MFWGSRSGAVVRHDDHVVVVASDSLADLQHIALFTPYSRKERQLMADP